MWWIDEDDWDLVLSEDAEKNLTEHGKVVAREYLKTIKQAVMQPHRSGKTNALMERINDSLLLGINAFTVGLDGKCESVRYGRLVSISDEIQKVVDHHMAEAQDLTLEKLINLLPEHMQAEYRERYGL